MSWCSFQNLIRQQKQWYSYPCRYYLFSKPYFSIKVWTRAMYLAFASSWTSPFKLFHASHLAFPFKSNIPGRAKPIKILMLSLVLCYYNAAQGHLANNNYKNLTCIDVSNSGLFEEPINLQQLIVRRLLDQVLYVFRSCVEILKMKIKIHINYRKQR